MIFVRRFINSSSSDISIFRKQSIRLTRACHYSITSVTLRSTTSTTDRTTHISAIRPTDLISISGHPPQRPGQSSNIYSQLLASRLFSSVKSDNKMSVTTEGSTSATNHRASADNALISSTSNESVSLINDPCFTRFAQHCQDKYGMDRSHLRSFISLVEAGSTIPFIVRYRNEVVTGIDTTAVFNINREVSSYETVVKIRASRLSKLEALGKLTPDLRRRFESVFSMHDLDELWAPFKESKDSKISQILAVDGMSELVDRILKGELQNIHRALHMGTCKYPFDEALLFALSDSIAHDARTVSVVQQAMKRRSPTISSKLKTNIQDPKYDASRCKYKDYHNMTARPLVYVKNHQLLALRRGQKEGILNISLEANADGLKEISHRLQRIFRVNNDTSTASDTEKPKTSAKAKKAAALQLPLNRNVLLTIAIEDAISRVIAPVNCRASYRDAMESADESALLVFRNNLKSLLLTPPLASYKDELTTSSSGTTSRSVTIRSVMSLDPGFAHGHKIAVIDFATNALLDTSKVFTKLSGNISSGGSNDKISLSDCENACKELQRLQVKHGIDAIAIGDGVGSKVAQQVVELAVKHNYLPSSITYAVVSEAGASVYSVSEVAKAEFPATEVSYLGGVSIARRFIHPMSELVKIEPESLGIGMYQHDLSSSVLNERLTEVIQECVNSGGVDVNTASAHLLQYVAGLNASRAKAIVEYRSSKGSFQSVADVRSVKGIGEISFHNAAGFLRVFNGTNPLDTSAVHPEHYDLLLRLLAWADASVNSSATSTGKISKGKRKASLFHIASAADIGSNRIKELCEYINSHKQTIPDDILLDLEANLSISNKTSSTTTSTKSSKGKRKATEDEGDNDAPTAKKAKLDTAIASSTTAASAISGATTATTDGTAPESESVSLRSAALHTVTKWMDWISRSPANTASVSTSNTTAAATASTSASTTTTVGGAGWVGEDIRAGSPPQLIRFDTSTREVVGRTTVSGQGSEPLHSLVGRSFEGVVKNVVPFGAFVDIGASNTGLLHRSQFSDSCDRPKSSNSSTSSSSSSSSSSTSNQGKSSFIKPKLSDVVIGQRLAVKVTGIKPGDRIELSLDV